MRTRGSARISPSERGALGAGRGGESRVQLPGDRERIGPQQDVNDHQRQAVRSDADQKRAPCRREPEGPARIHRQPHQARADDGARRRAPHDQPHRAATRGARAHVGRRVAREQVRGIGDAEEHHADEQEREAPDEHARHGELGTHHREAVAHGEPGPPPEPCHQSRERPARERRPERAHRDGHARPRIGAGDLGGHDPADRHADRMAGAAADLGREQGAHQPPTRPRRRDPR